MSILKTKNRIELFDYLVRHQMTGTPKELAQELKMSKRQLYNFLEELKAMNVPIQYCKKQQHYYYEKDGSLVFYFGDVKPLKTNELHEIKGGYLINTNLFQNGSSYLFYG
jgi:transcriptional antiterminator